MTYRFLFLLIFINSTFNLKAQTEFYPEKTIDIKLYGGKASGSSFFDLESKTIFDLIEKASGDEEMDTLSFNLNEYTFGIRGEYGLTENTVLFAEIPIKYTTLIEKTDTTVFDTSGQAYSFKLTRADFSLVQPAYYSIGARYRYYSKIAYSALSAELRIPPGFHNGILNDPDYEFLSDGALEVRTGVILGIKFEKSWLESSIDYFYRAEELVDYIQIHTEAGLKTVPGSKLMAYVDFVQSIGSFEDAIRFNPSKSTLQENILDAGLFFQLFVTDNLYCEFSYKLNLTGKNAWNVGGFLLGLGVRL